MDTFRMILAAFVGIFTIAIFVVSYFYLDKKSTGDKNKKVSNDTASKDTAKETSNDAAEPQESDKPLSSEAMMKCPFSYFEHIPGEVKKTEHQKIQKTIEENMSPSEKEREREVQRQQMQDIFKLMQGQEETFGMSDINEMQDQLKMYSPNI